MNSKHIYDLLISIDKGHTATEKELSELASVRKIRWRNIDDLPSCMKLLTGLNDLDLRGTNVKDISPLDNLVSLSRLNLEGTSVNNINPLAGLISLSVLNLCGTNVSNIRALSRLTSLYSLNLMGTPVNNISDLADLTSLSILDLSNTGMNDISPLSKLTSLLSLRLSNTTVSNICDLAGLTSLSSLYLNSTAIRTISPLATLSLLSHLDLSFSNVSDISSLAGLSSLSYLNLSFTNVTELDSLANITRLERLYLANTKIKDLSPLSHLKSLKILDLHNAETAFIPESLLDLNLAFNTDTIISNPGIYIKGLNLIEQDISIFNQPRKLLLEYYKSEKIPVNRCKVVFLGDGGAGKSLIINRLLNDGEISSDFMREATNRIDIYSHSYFWGNEKINLSFWDFGGQAILHSMHRMFLTNRTLYVIAINARENDPNEQAWYWIQNVKSFVDDAPIFLVINHWEENPFVHIDISRLRNEYPTLVAVQLVSALTASAVDFNTNIRDQILKIVQSMETVHTPFPKSWLSLMNKLNGMEEDHITSNDFYTMCKESGIKADDQIRDSIIEWYQDLGVCFFTKNQCTSSEYMVLKPQWLLNALYILIFSGKKYAENGIIPENKINLIYKDFSTEINQEIYRNNKYNESDIAFIIQVLIDFNLVRRLDNKTIFVPMLCDDDAPMDLEETFSQYALHYSFYYTYLPDNVLYRLMLHQQHALNLKTAKRTLAVFEHDNFGWKSLVRIQGKHLDIYTKSLMPQEYPAVRYMDVLCEDIRRINQDLGLKTEEYVTFREDSLEDRFNINILEESKRAGLPKIYSAIFHRILKIDEILGKQSRAQDKMTEDIIEHMASALEEMSLETVYLKDRDERELTAEFQGRIKGILNLQYRIQVAREYTMGRAKKTIGETDLYFYREENGNREHLYILENKVIQDFKTQYKQLMGYLNPYFRAGITLSINKEMGWEKAFDYICEKLEDSKKEGGDFAPIMIYRNESTSITQYVLSEHIVPETGYTMPVYHLVMQLSDKHRHDIAIKARS